ncbi:MAG: O-antigen ligase family protein [Crocinitomicaceae bacterium]|nr:O-antigen ligase family protein [Crocinitomicaceae bacterium]
MMKNLQIKSVLNLMTSLTSRFENMSVTHWMSLCYASLLFLATLFFANEYYYLLVPLAIVLFNLKSISDLKQSIRVTKKVKTSIGLILIYISTSYINKLITGHPILILKDYYASFLLFPLLIFTAYIIDLKKVFRYFLYWVAFECLIASVEYYFGVRSFFIENVPKINNSSDYLYDHRVNGLSISSSVFALKLLVAVISIEFVQLNLWLKNLLKTMLFTGVLFSFNRALIISVLVFWVLLLGYQLITSSKLELKHLLLKGTNIFLFSGVFFVFANHNILVELGKKNPEKKQLELKYKTEATQLTYSEIHDTPKTVHYPRMKVGNELDTNAFVNKLFYNSTKGINTSGRTLIWMNYFQYINEHKWFGYGSDKLLFKTINQDDKKLKLIHAHNSFLQILASNGILITLLFLSITFFIWTKKNFLILIPILVYSCFQYGIFWGFSLLDVFFFGILMINTNLLHEE